MAQGVGIGASGVIGIAFEVTPGTYIAPTKYFPIRSETIGKTQDMIQRRILRGVVDINGTVKGATSVEGDIEMEAYEDVLPYMLMAARASVVKSGAGPNYIYTAVGTHAAEPVNGKTLSITVVRNGVAFGYVGCSVGSIEFSLDNGLLINKFAIVGLDEATQAAPTPTYSVVDAYGPGAYTYLVAAAPICDNDNIAFKIEDNASAETRVCQRAAKFVRWGERETTASLERDFISRVDYDGYMAQTAQALDFTASKGANNSIQVQIPVAQKDKYELGLSGQTDLIRAAIDYVGVYDPTTLSAWKMIVKTQENIV
jgi:hypothetical protein